MPTVLVPLDETAFAESILPDAQQLAGPGGRLVLVYVAARRGRAGTQSSDTDAVERYLSNEAQLPPARRSTDSSDRKHDHHPTDNPNERRAA